MTIKEQVKLITGKQKVVCPDCQKTMSLTVSGEKKDSRRQTYREYKGSCRHCKTIVSGIVRR